MAQTYQLTREGQFGSSLKVVPVTTEQETNVKTCLQANGTLQNKIMPQSVLPDLTEFKVSRFLICKCFPKRVHVRKSNQNCPMNSIYLVVDAKFVQLFI